MKWISMFLAAVFVFTGEAWAQDCKVSASPVSFGAYNPLTSSSIDATGNITISCDPSIPFVIKLDAGLNSGGSFTPRKIKISAGTGMLNYNLYRDSAHTEIWGNEKGNTYTRSGAGTGLKQQFTVYGRLPGSQNVSVGSYGDMITVTIEY